jgi:hypothetical protein
MTWTIYYFSESYINLGLTHDSRVNETKIPDFSFWLKSKENKTQVFKILKEIE